MAKGYLLKTLSTYCVALSQQRKASRTRMKLLTTLNPDSLLELGNGFLCISEHYVTKLVIIYK